MRAEAVTGPQEAASWQGAVELTTTSTQYIYVNEALGGRRPATAVQELFKRLYTAALFIKDQVHLQKGPSDTAQCFV
jgi:hypothetical protein